MYKHRTKAKADTNQTDIVKALRKIPGVTVETGKDDILVGRNKKTYWFELKNPEAVSKKTGKVLDSKIKDSQKTLLETWQGHYSIVWTLDQILEQIRE